MTDPVRTTGTPEPWLKNRSSGEAVNAPGKSSFVLRVLKDATVPVV